MAIRFASARRDHRATGWPSSSTSPAVGASRPPSSLTSVVLPEPFGPRMPTKAPGATSSDTSPTTRRGVPEARLRPPYENDRLWADSNPHTSKHRPAERRVAIHFFVRPIEQVQRAPVDLDPGSHAPAGAGVKDEEAWRGEQPPESPVVRLDIEHCPARARFGERRDRPRHPQQIERALVTRAADERIADAERRRRVVGAIDRQH